MVFTMTLEVDVIFVDFSQEIVSQVATKNEPLKTEFCWLLHRSQILLNPFCVFCVFLVHDSPPLV